MQLDFLESLLTNNSILLHHTAATWEAAVKIVFKPYYIIAPKLAMPHTRPKEGVLKNAFSLVSLTEPVLFADNQPVSLLIGFVRLMPKLI
ncbi:hypothetical protein P344_04790 [Spiroplasma mirum ATCC 29335]|uniref:Ascorbate-specific PTS system EIIA component n=1 Tax=Spiroplasma mirum ATCC 29335 TaxID=838561 RepID=W0GLS4_9MOLU|nr:MULTISPECIES: PTS sugar transporter subunit IIA [Spiroplasma]AHF61195.1 truncated PTS system IIA component [Spiroplasma mirum ATCC 29335]AHI58280.1 hypothetical protein P344_04790 [Spiroplasma mirum ATCC 29335]